MLKNYIYKGEEIDKDLYRGNISDIKQLEYLSQEKKWYLKIDKWYGIGHIINYGRNRRTRKSLW